MIEIKDKQILIDGKPQIIMCGEIHYYRLKPEDWQDRIDKLKEAGCNAVASYVPWLCHEPAEGSSILTVIRTRSLTSSALSICARRTSCTFSLDRARSLWRK